MSDTITPIAINQGRDERFGEQIQYLTFSLANEEYGVNILDVQEVRVWTKVTVLPNTPPYVKGVLNLRGTIVPIIDLRLYFGLPEVDYGPTTVIVVLRLVLRDKDRTIGLVVDAVSDVLDIGKDQTKTTEEFDITTNTEAIIAVASVQEKLIVLLDASKLLTEGQLSDLSKELYGEKNISGEKTS